MKTYVVGIHWGTFKEYPLILKEKKVPECPVLSGTMSKHCKIIF